MIIRCEQCLTRFKIPDEKVSPKGVKVRCAKCQHTFRVVLQAAPPPPAAPPPEADPFGLFDVPQPATEVPLSFGTPAVADAAEPPPAPEPSSGGGPSFDFLASPDPTGVDPGDAFGVPVDEPAAPSAAASLDAFGLDAREPPAPAPVDVDLGTGEEPDRSFFEMPPALGEPEARDSAPSPLLADIPDLAGEPDGTRRNSSPEGVPVAKLALRRVSATELAALQAEDAAPKARTGWGVRAVQTVVGAMLFALVGGAGVVVLNGGSLPRFGLRAGEEVGGGVRVARVHSGVYESVTGKPLLFVRGEVENPGRGRVDRVRVRAELREAGQPVRWAQVLAGASVTPEEVYRIASAADAEALRNRLEGGAKALDPDGRVPFLLTFVDFPPETDGLTVHVSAQPEPLAAARVP